MQNSPVTPYRFVSAQYLSNMTFGSQAVGWIDFQKERSFRKDGSFSQGKRSKIKGKVVLSSPLIFQTESRHRRKLNGLV